MTHVTRVEVSEQGATAECSCGGWRREYVVSARRTCTEAESLARSAAMAHRVSSAMADDEATQTIEIDGGLTSEAIANATWRRGLLHLSIDEYGLVSLWDREIPGKTFVLQLTADQVAQMEVLRKSRGVG